MQTKSLESFNEIDSDTSSFLLLKISFIISIGYVLFSVDGAVMFSERASPSRNRLMRASHLSISGHFFPAELTRKPDANSTLSQERPRPLNLSDNFKIVLNVPAIVFGENLGSGPGSSSRGRNFVEVRRTVFSDDATRMALVSDPESIEVYDAFDGFRILARYCLESEKVVHVHFWNGLNGTLVVVSNMRKVNFLKVRNESIPSHEARSKAVWRQFNIETIVSYSITHPRREKQLENNQIVMCGTTVWIVEDFHHELESALFTSISKKGIRSLQVDEACNQVDSFFHFSIPRKGLMHVTFEEKDPEKKFKSAKTKIWLNIGFNYKRLDVAPIQLDGRGLGWTKDGKYAFLHVVGKQGKHRLDVHKSEELKATRDHELDPIRSISLGHEVLDLKIKFVQRQQNMMLETEDMSLSSLPLVAIFIIRSGSQSCLVWDPWLDQIIREIDLKMQTVSYLPSEKDLYCISSDMKWIGVYWQQNEVFAIFSLVSSSLIWFEHLSNLDRKAYGQCIITFDPFSTKFLVELPKAVFVFFPMFMLDRNQSTVCCNSLIPKEVFKFPHRHFEVYQYRPVPKHFLFQVYRRHVFTEEQKLLVDITNMVDSLKIAVVVLINALPSIYVGTHEELCSDRFFQHIKGLQNEELIAHELEEITFEGDMIEDYFFNPHVLHIFSFRNEDDGSSAVVLFSLKNGVHAVFVDLKKKQDKETITFHREQGFAIKQSQDNRYVVCLRVHGIQKIDLNERTALFNVLYQADLIQGSMAFRFFTNCPNVQALEKEFQKNGDVVEFVSLASKLYGLCDISDDAQNILVGWDLEKKEKMLLSASFRNEEVHELQERAHENAICFALSGDFKRVLFIEESKKSRNISSLSMFNDEDMFLKKHSKKDWNCNEAACFGNISFESDAAIYAELDNSSGSLSFQCLSLRAKEPKWTTVVMRPQSLKECQPPKQMIRHIARNSDIEELNEFALQFGPIFFRKEIEDLTKFHEACKFKDSRAMRNLLDANIERDHVFDLLWIRKGGVYERPNLLQEAIKDKNDAMVEIALQIIVKQLIPFQDAALAAKECFKDLWMEYRTLMDPIIENNELAWTVCEVLVPSDIFNVAAHIEARMGTSNILLDWKNEGDRDSVLHAWTSLNQEHVNIIKTKGSSTRVKAKIMFFCMDDICKIGSSGILRFLVMRKSKSSLFKTDIVRWVIEWKWKALWKRRCLFELFIYTCFLFAFTGYAICIAYYSRRLQHDFIMKLILTSLLFISTSFASIMLSEEYIKLRTYRKDGAKFFRNGSWEGIKYYLSSRWNIHEVLTHVLLLNVVPFFHTLCMFTPDAQPLLIGFVAIVVALVWMKVWYYAQAFKQTGALVLMIENVIIDCLAFLFLAFVALIGFAIAMFVIFKSLLVKRMNESDDLDDDLAATPIYDQDVGGDVGRYTWISNKGSKSQSQSQGQEQEQSQNPGQKQDEDDEIFEQVHTGFSTPKRALVTMFYVMVGALETDIYIYEYGILSIFISVIFISYVAIQVIVLFNMLIAIMGDTFDRVKSTEEENMLMGRARFIDACEASLLDKDIEEIEKRIGKYFYVLYPRGEDLSDDTALWQGRVRHLENMVQKIIVDSERKILEELDFTRKGLKSLETNTKERLGELQRETRNGLDYLQEETKMSLEKLQVKTTEQLNTLQIETKQSLETLQKETKDKLSILQEETKIDLTALREESKEHIDTLKIENREALEVLQKEGKEDLKQSKEELGEKLEIMQASTQVDSQQVHGEIKTVNDYQGRLQQQLEGVVQQNIQEIQRRLEHFEDFFTTMSEGHYQSLDHMDLDPGSESN